MKYLYLILVFQLASLNLGAQLKIFPKATYKVAKDFCSKRIVHYSGRTLVQYSISDTFVTVSGRRYQPLLFSTSGYHLRKKTVHFIRQEKAKVFILHKTQTDSTREKLFVDFNANIGDTIAFCDNFWGDCRFTLIRTYDNLYLNTIEYTYRVEHYESHAIKAGLIPGIVEFTITQDYGIIELYTNNDGKELDFDYFCVTSYYPHIIREGCGN